MIKIKSASKKKIYSLMVKGKKCTLQGNIDLLIVIRQWQLISSA